ncbi:hypothetical protein IJ182_02465 [bacterium]|nr:hypothetical protein [bacterium]
MGKLPKLLLVWIFIIIFQSSIFAFQYENTADNPRLINLSPQQHKALNRIEKRLYGKTFEFDNNVDRIERLELDFFEEIQKGNISERLNALKIESTQAAIRGTAMTPMMESTFNTRYINPKGPDVKYHEDVGIIDGLLRVWWPELYSQVNEYRRYKEANFF